LQHRGQMGTSPTADRAAAPGLISRRGDLLILAAGCALAAAVFAGSLTGAFVYDDLFQIVENDLIRNPAHFWKALTSDVWAFQGDRPEAWTNSWRPAFVLWLMLNYRLFGLDNPIGWHAANILLHIGAGFLGYGLLRRLRVERWVAAAILFIFLVHPVHVESVAWISGSPDLLATIGMLGALWCELSAGQRGRPGLRVAAILLFALAVLTKEFSVVFPAIVFIAVMTTADEMRSRRALVLSAIARAAPYAVLTGVFLLARYLVLGQMVLPFAWRAGSFAAVATIPSMLAFYVRQVFFPFWIGPSYPLRPVTIDTIGFANFVAPLIGVAAMSFLLIRVCRRDPVRQLGLALFLLPLLPAMNAKAFIPEQLVHDRYLYLPLLGMLMVVVPAIAAWLQRVLVGRELTGRRIFWAVIGAVCVFLMIQTVRYSSVWKSEAALWEGSVRCDPFSAFNYSRYAGVLRQAGGLREARLAADRAIELSPNMTYPYLIRAGIDIEEGRFGEAESDLRRVLAWFDNNPEVY
jgi:protein O-mannosyl-transferase